MDNALIPSTEEMQTYQLMAKTASASAFFSKMGGEAGILSIMLMARELGLPAMQSLMGGMTVINGKVEISPRMMNSMIRKAGHRIETVKSTNTICELKGVRVDTKETLTVSYTIDDAKAASLIRSGSGWEKYPADMLFARCISRLARRLFADVISTAYVQGEISDKIEPIEIEAEPVSVEEVPVVQESIESNPTLSFGEMEMINDLIGEDEDLKARIVKGYKVTNLCDIPRTNFMKIKSKLEARKSPK